MMHQDHNRPSARDAVLGGTQIAPTTGGMVLGGLAGIEQRSIAGTEAQKIDGLARAIAYGDEGLTFAIRALRDESEAVRLAAYALLKDRPENRVKQALRLISARGIDYRNLRDLLAMKRWQAADLETTDVLLKLSRLAPDRRLTNGLIQQLPYEDLKLIDGLWRKYSDRKFGFSVQQSIWQECSTSRANISEAWSLFADRVGWRYGIGLPHMPLLSDILHHTILHSDLYFRWKRYDELTFAANAPVGHLPYVCGIYSIEAICDRLQVGQSDSI